jgi:hypothetical protein
MAIAKRDWKIAGVTAAIVIVSSGVGAWVGASLLAAADQSESCAPRSVQGSWNGLQISGLPDSLQLPFGYGRGTRTVQNVITVTAPAGASLPDAIPIFVEPLVTSDGSQMIPLTAPTTASAKPSPSSGPSGTATASGSASASATPPNGASGTATASASAGAGAGARPESNQLVSATATRIASSSTYQIELCITPSSVAAGSYSGQLLFPGAKLASGTSLPVTVTFQSRLVPFVLTVGGLPLALFGILYTTLILIRRSNSGLALAGVVSKLYDELWSINGLVALLLSVGAVFTAWYAQCFRDSTWGSPWPTILIALGTMAGAAAGASTVPMGLSNS